MTTLRKSVWFVGSMNERMTQHRFQRPNEEWYAYASKNISTYAEKSTICEM